MDKKNRRSLVFVIGVLIFVFVLFKVLGGGPKNEEKQGKDLNKGGTKTGEDGINIEEKGQWDENENQPDINPPSDCLPEGVSYDELSNEKKAWWFKRNKEHLPSGADESIHLKEYGAYYLGNTEEQMIYLTFDCGYENGYTERMLDILKKHNAKACFFVTQTYIRDNPELVKG